MLAVPARSSSTKVQDPSPTSTASTQAPAMSDNASTGSKRKRRRGEGEGSSVKSGGRTRKPGGIGRLFTVFLCCRSSTTADDDAQPARPANQQRQAAVPTRTMLHGNEQVGGTSPLDSGIGRSLETVETEKFSEKPKDEAVPASSKIPVSAGGVENGVDTVSKDAVDGKALEKRPEAPTPSTVLAAPITVAIQSPTPTVSHRDDFGALPEAPFPPAPTMGEETDMTDTDTIDDKTGEPSGRRKDEAIQVALPSTSSSEKEDTDMYSTTSNDEAEGHAAIDGTAVENAAGKDRQQWLLPPLRPEFEGKKCLVLDLDETLVHSSFKVSFVFLKLPHDSFCADRTLAIASSRLHNPG